jgi:hypothetical protein
MSEEKLAVSFDWSGIKIPLGVDTKKAISKMVKDEAYNLINNDATFMKDMLAHVLIDNKKCIVELLKPVIRELFEEKAFTINIKGWWNDE